MTTGQNASPMCRDIEPLERSPEGFRPVDRSHRQGDTIPKQLAGLLNVLLLARGGSTRRAHGPVRHGDGSRQGALAADGASGACHLE